MDGSVLDTNVVIKCVRGDAEAEAMLSSLSLPLYLPATVIGELIFGAFKSSQTARNMAIFHGFAAQCITLPADQRVAEAYGRLKASLSSKGVNIPENDCWIAASAIAQGLPLATFDKHFAAIDDLLLA